MSDKSIIVFVNRYEQLFGGTAHHNFCVTEAMSRFLGTWGIQYVLVDFIRLVFDLILLAIIDFELT